MDALPEPVGAVTAPGKAGATLGRRAVRRVADLLLGKVATILLAAVALGLGFATFVLLSRGATLSVRPNLVFGLVLANLCALLLLAAVLAVRLTRVWVERRKGSAGARLHVRLVMMFGLVAVTPAIVVALFATAFFHLGIQAWFNDRVRTVLGESLEASRGYLEEHRNNIRVDALAMANDLTRAGQMFADDPDAFGQILLTATALRGLTSAVIYEPSNGQVFASVGLPAAQEMGTFGSLAPLLPEEATAQARSGEVAVLGGRDDRQVRALVKLDAHPELMLLISRPVDPRILDHMRRTEEAVAEYQRLDKNRSGLQITFVLIFGLVALLVLSAAVLIGLMLANQIARPIGGLIRAAERVRAGDLATRVPEEPSADEIAGLSRAFNRMTGQLAAQRAELMDAYGQLDERRRFTETVLSGVSAGVIGLDMDGTIELPNRAAGELLGLDPMSLVGQRLADAVPEFAPLLAAAAQRALGGGPRTAEVAIGPPSRRRTLLARINPEVRGGHLDGYVATFDDITELQAAQRKAAWADVARRIAHEIKNPLTPIQLSAERLKRRFTKEIQSDPETFAQCADTIVRHVGDIGRMVDEFSAFARMPQPALKPEDVGRIAREALILQRSARPEIAWETRIPERGPMAQCDRRLLGQALTNLLQNAADAVAMRPRAPGEPATGHIVVAVEEREGRVSLRVEDDGIGLPQEDRDRLAEPYVTHKPKGTGLGLAIVKKIMEDHGGALMLDDRAGEHEGGSRGAVATLVLPALASGVAAA